MMKLLISATMVVLLFSSSLSQAASSGKEKVSWAIREKGSGQVAPKVDSSAGSAFDDTFAVYGDLLFGGYWRNMADDNILSAEISYQNLSKSAANKISSGWNRDKIGMVAGFDVGYQMTPVLSIEGGFIWLQSQQLNFNSGSNADNSFVLGSNYFYADSHIRFSTWLGYAGLRADWNLIPSLSLYGKAVIVYADTSIDIHQVAATTSNDAASTVHWSPGIGFGMIYHLPKNWQISLQYLCVFTSGDLDKDHMFVHRSFSTFDNIDLPVIHLLTLGVGYRMAL